MRMRSRNQSRAGFTLMELLLVMAILVVMGGMVSFAFLNIQTRSMSDLTLTQINTLEQACMSYKLKHNRFPNSLKELVQPPGEMSNRKWGGPFLQTDKLPQDPWGNPYKYSKEEAKNRVTIISPGPDGQIKTVDDVPDPEETRNG